MKRNPRHKKKPAPKKKAQQKINSAYRAAVEEIAQENVAEIKTMVRDTLEAMRQREQQIKRETALLAEYRHDLEDLKRGRLDAIKKRRETRRYVGDWQVPFSPINPDRIGSIVNTFNSTSLPASAGTYMTSSGNWVGGLTSATVTDFNKAGGVQ